MYVHPQQGHNNSEVQQLRQEAGRWLKSLREAAQLSQRQLAEKVGIEYYTFISQIESGRGRIPPERYAAFAHAFGLEPAPFVKALMRYYDPITHGLLFGANGGADESAAR
jgi:transcriptional regulator with XRE-family HTH domain